jgi:hypothetical protein
MNRKPSDNAIREVFAGGMSAVPVPPLDLSAIRTRAAAAGDAARRPRGVRFTRPALVLAPLAVIAVVFLASVPQVVAQVERVLHAFAVIDGQKVPLTVRTVSLADAQRQMPFRVVAPVAVPRGLAATIDALQSADAPASARLVFRYRAPGSDLPVLTIEESAASANGPTKVMISEQRTVGGPPRGAAPDLQAPPPADAAAPGKPGVVLHEVEIRTVNGKTVRHAVELRPVMWVQGGTRIVLASAPGTLSDAQIATIRAAMMR